MATVFLHRPDKHAMNLMFWKKKPGTEEEAPANIAAGKRSRESLDFIASKQGAHAEPELPEPETAAPAASNQGPAAWIKSRFAALAGHFKKAPEFRAESEPAADKAGSSEMPDTAALDTKAALPARSALAVRIKSLIHAMVRRFRKAPAPDAAESPEAELPDTSGDASLDDDYESYARARTKKRLVVGGIIGLFVVLLVGMIVVSWTTSAPPHEPLGIQQEPDAASHPPIEPEKSQVDPLSQPVEAARAAAANSQSEIEALRKENAELQARIEALTNKREQQTDAPTDDRNRRNAASQTTSGEVLIGNDEPKAAAMSLKEAIEAMNAETGDYRKKPGK